MNKFICIDIGGTAIKYGIVQSDGTVVKAKETPTEASWGGKALAKKVFELAKECKEAFPEVKGVAISSAGIVDTQNASILYASDAIPGYAGIHFRKELADLDLPIEIENDVNCAGLSEYADGSANGSQSALVLTIGTGIGGCFIDQGRLHHGHTYSACEVGYMPLFGEPFQNLAAASVMVTRVADRKQEPVEMWNGRKIFELASQNDVICQEEIERLCTYLGQGIAAICYILNPEVVVLGGGIMAQEKVLRPLIEESFTKASIPLISNATRIEFASHQNAAGMKGALVHFLSQHPELA